LKELSALRSKYPSVLSGGRGKGLLIGLEFPSDAIGYRCAGALFRRGVLVAGTFSKARTIRIEPPLGISWELLREMLNRLEDSIREIAPGCRSPSVTRDPLLEIHP
jgi:putrescine aminotransferase